ncbi:MAG: Bifunctional enzyme IspD/IspF [Thermoanaerobacterales bacterium 50_218]|nr:MAG: Bifunctional enzyme IspD/IspF [Thermoanaerobacterales bacterium 50_218]HAA90608.1 bifunctional 2-C-methyl-D-erythritol 4-phosphate cytidylyltransferase/2-C-methyl-D-erythritol 2,4-cyclodiphosphate synthase [Peptococcaceae bacterium]
MARTGGIIVAAGRGKRMGYPVNKVYLPLGGRPLILYSLDVFERSPLDCYIVVAHPEEVRFCEALFAFYNYQKLLAVVPGGETRQDSVAAGLKALPDDCELVAVHDGARPLLSLQVFEGALKRAHSCWAVVVAVQVKDTVKVVGETGEVSSTPDRSRLWLAQTPQIFRLDILKKAYAEAEKEGFVGTDDASLVERLGIAVEVYPGEEENIKVTTPADMELAELLLKKRQRSVQKKAGAPSFPRVGLGYDVHPFTDKRPLILGGVKIPEGPGLAGHSDADVVAHALIDACLGAAGLSDIGHHFPAGDPCWKDAPSLALLCCVNAILADAGYRVSQVDVVIAAETPRLAPYLPEMRRRLAAVLGIAETDVSVKATTTEGLGFTGRREGIAAWAVATLVPISIL